MEADPTIAKVVKSKLLVIVLLIQKQHKSNTFSSLIIDARTLHKKRRRFTRAFSAFARCTAALLGKLDIHLKSANLPEQN